MLSKTRAGRNCALILLSFLSVLSFSAIIPDTFAQTPNAAPLAILLSLPSGVPSALRPRRVSTPAASATGPSLDEATVIERRAFELTNSARSRSGLAPLTWNPGLCQMARVYSEKMVRLGFFSHESPDGLHLEDRAHAAGIAHFRMLGENIAYNQGFDDPGGFAVERWMLSPGHRANILNAGFRQSAIGVFVAPDGTVYLTQEFFTR
jgi:uncharacterized protein YkwD